MGELEETKEDPPALSEKKLLQLYQLGIRECVALGIPYEIAQDVGMALVIVALSGNWNIYRPIRFLVVDVLRGMGLGTSSESNPLKKFGYWKREVGLDKNHEKFEEEDPKRLERRLTELGNSFEMPLRGIFFLKYKWDFTNGEIAQVFGKPREWVDRKAVEIHKALRPLLL